MVFNQIFYKMRSVLFFLISLLYLHYKQDECDPQLIACSPSYYNGNVKAIYEYLLKDPRYNNCDIYWVALNHDECKKMSNDGIRAFQSRDMFQIKRFAKTGLWITDHGPGTIPLYWLFKWNILSLKRIKGRSIWVDTWHGIGFKTHKKEDYGQKMYMYDIQFVTSDFFKEIYVNKFGFKKEQLYITGYPRNDILYDEYEKHRAEIVIQGHKSENIILYAPTYENIRNFDSIFPWDLKNALKSIDIICEKFNYLFYIRPHPNSGVKRNETNILKNYKNIKIFDMTEEPNTQKLLLDTAILITDWSSICFDFILLRRPIIFIDSPFPYNEFTLGPDDRPGKIVKDLDELIKELSLIMKAKKNYVSQNEDRILAKCYNYIDGSASERCADILYESMSSGNF